MSVIEEHRDVWVYVEVSDGKEKSVGIELLGPGRRLVKPGAEKLTAVVVGHKVEAVASTAIAYGADSAIVVDD